MSTLITIAAGDQITNSRADLNTNFSTLNTDKEEVSNKSTDTAFTANSDTLYPSQKATKSYIDSRTGGIFAAGVSTYDMTLSSTLTIAHGLGTAPTLVRVTAMFATGTTSTMHSLAYAVVLSGTQRSVSSSIQDETSSAGTGLMSQTFKMTGGNGGTNHVIGTITVDATNISIAWSKNGTPTGTMNIVWEAIK